MIVQADDFAFTNSVTICSFTADPTEAPDFRLNIEPSAENGLHAASRIMVDKVATVPKTKIGSRIGQLGSDDVGRLDAAIIIFLGLATTAPSRT